MCMGRYTRFKRVVVYFLCMMIAYGSFPRIAFANPVIIGLGEIFGSVIARRAAIYSAEKAADIAFTRQVAAATIQNVEKSALAKQLLVPKSNFLSRSGQATWAGLGTVGTAYSLYDLFDDVFDSSVKFVNGEANSSGGYTVTVDGVQTDVPFSPVPVYRSPANAGIGEMKLWNGQLVYMKDASGKDVRGMPYLPAYRNPTGSTWVIYSLTDEPIFNTWISTVGTKGTTTYWYSPNGQTGATQVPIFTYQRTLKSGETLPNIGSSILQSADELQQVAGQTEVKAEVLAQTINDLMHDAATQTGYDGVPFSDTDAVTVAEIKDLLAKDNGVVTKAGVFDSAFKSDGTVNIPNKVKTAESPGIDLGENPNIKEPDLGDTPTAKQIMEPVITPLSWIDNMKLSGHAAFCPTGSFEVFDTLITIDSQCDLFEKLRDIAKVVSTLIWAIVALRVVLSA